MFYRYGGSFIGTMCDTNRWVKMYQESKVRICSQSGCWWSTETQFADVILPACTNFERNDISEWGNAGGYSQHLSTVCNHRVFIYQQKCIEPLGNPGRITLYSRLAERLALRNNIRKVIPKKTGSKRCLELLIYQSISLLRNSEKGYFVAPQLRNINPHRSSMVL